MLKSRKMNGLKRRASLILFVWRLPTCSCITITESAIITFLIFISFDLRQNTSPSATVCGAGITSEDRGLYSPLLHTRLHWTFVFSESLFTLNISRGDVMSQSAAPCCIDLTSTRLQLLASCHSRSQWYSLLSKLQTLLRPGIREWPSSRHHHDSSLMLSVLMLLSRLDQRQDLDSCPPPLCSQHYTMEVS